MAVRMHVKSLDSPSKTRSGTIYSETNISRQDIDAARILISLRNRPVVIPPISVNNDVQHRYNTRYASRMNTPRY